MTKSVEKNTKEQEKPSESSKENTNEIKLENIKSLLMKKSSNFFEIFDIISFLGAGSESEVFKAYFKEYQVNVAIKFIFISDERKINENEINISFKLRHKNILTFHFCGEIIEKELYCIVMEHAAFGNTIQFMHGLLHKMVLSETVLCYYTYQVLQGIKYIHSNKICHMDIKPHNIVIDAFLNPKLIDFSISLDYSKYSSDAKIKLPFKGTSLFMAPEIIFQKYVLIRDINKIDLYSLGITLYLLAFGFYPYGLVTDDINDYCKVVYKMIKNDRLNFNNREKPLSAGCVDFLKKLLDINIDKRINIDQALNHYWVKGGKIIMDEKEKVSHGTKFLNYMNFEHFYSFNEYLKNYK